MKYLLLSIAVIIGSGLLFGKLASDFVDQEVEKRVTKFEQLTGQKQLTPKEQFCKQQAGWHPDCNVE